MAKKQHAWALLKPEAQAMLEPSMVQPTEAMVTVTDANGHDVQVAEYHGGFALIESLHGWRMLIGCGIDSVFSAMVQQLQAAGAQMGSPVGVLLAIVDDVAGTEEPNLEQLEALMPAQNKSSVDAWLVVHGHDTAPSGSYRDVIEYVGGLFRPGFAIGQDSIH